MVELDALIGFAGQARSAAPFELFARAATVINRAGTPFELEDRDANRAVAALEAVFLMLANDGTVSFQTEERFHAVADALMAHELAEDMVDELYEGFCGALDEQGFDLRLESVGEPLRGDRPLTEGVFRLCVAALRASGTEVDEDDTLLDDLADSFDLSDKRADKLRREAVAALTALASDE